MKTIFIYGAPGVGKLTVANELSKLTGFSLLHNHLFNDFVKTIFDFGSKEFNETVRKYRLDLMERVAVNKQKGIILTYVYNNTTDDSSIRKIVKQARKYRGQILFVHLICDVEELLKRIKNPSRKVFGKVKTHKTLYKIMEKYNLFAEVPFQPNLIINNTKLSPQKAAKFIQRHYQI